MADEKYVLNEGICISYPKMKFCESSSNIHEMARQSNCVTYVTKSWHSKNDSQLHEVTVAQVFVQLFSSKHLFENYNVDFLKPNNTTW